MQRCLPRTALQSLLGYDLHKILRLVDALCRYNAANAALGINVSVMSDDGTGVQNGAAANLNAGSEECADFLAAGLNGFALVLDNHELLVRAHIRGERLCTLSKRITFLSSVELPTTAPSPTSALPRINAPGRTSVPLPMMQGPVMEAVG